MNDEEHRSIIQENQPERPRATEGAGGTVPARSDQRSAYLLENRPLPSSAEDPIDRYIRIMRDDALDSTEKRWLIDRAAQRFENRRRMAYIALGALVGTLLLVLVGAIVDGIAQTTILEKLDSTSNLLGGINALLTAIIAAYYGASSIRPSS